MTKDQEQKKLLKACGFKLDYVNSATRVWVRGDLRIALLVGRCPSLKNLIRHIICQTMYRVQRGTKLVYGDVNIGDQVIKSNALS